MLVLWTYCGSSGSRRAGHLAARRREMSITGILSTLTSNIDTQSIRSRMQQFRNDFQQLGKDLQTGNLAGAQADFAAPQKDGPQTRSASQSSDPIAQDFDNSGPTCSPAT